MQPFVPGKKTTVGQYLSKTKRTLIAKSLLAYAARGLVDNGSYLVLSKGKVSEAPQSYMRKICDHMDKLGYAHKTVIGARGKTEADGYTFAVVAIRGR